MNGYVIFFPWYEIHDYPQFQSTKEGLDLPLCYQDWLQQAASEITEALAAGKALQIVRLRPGCYSQWLTSHGFAHNATERHRYLAELGHRAGCDISNEPHKVRLSHAATRH